MPEKIDGRVKHNIKGMILSLLSGGEFKKLDQIIVSLSGAQMGREADGPKRSGIVWALQQLVKDGEIISVAHGIYQISSAINADGAASQIKPVLLTSKVADQYLRLMQAPVTAPELAVHMGVKPARVYRVMQSLIEAGLAQKIHLRSAGSQNRLMAHFVADEVAKSYRTPADIVFSWVYPGMRLNIRHASRLPGYAPEIWKTGVAELEAAGLVLIHRGRRSTSISLTHAGLKRHKELDGHREVSLGELSFSVDSLMGQFAYRALAYLSGRRPTRVQDISAVAGFANSSKTKGFTASMGMKRLEAMGLVSSKKTGDFRRYTLTRMAKPFIPAIEEWHRVNNLEKVDHASAE